MHIFYVGRNYCPRFGALNEQPATEYEDVTKFTGVGPSIGRKAVTGFTECPK